ncbi:MAG: hypothetical protein C0506_08525 [Anaerolinea sp.]|nr:hypothetical protein [Anaerolinea sp.]
MALALTIATLGGVLFLVLGWMSLLAKLPPNTWAGIRTPYTRKSEENWYATHRAAAPVLIWSGVAVVATGLAFVPFALAGKLDDGLVAVVTFVLAGLLLGGAVGSWFYGTRVAKSHRT